MGLFGKKKEAKEQKPIEEVMAQNVFGKTQTLMYDKIVAISQNTGFEKKMGNYIGITITTADGKDRIVRCVSNEANQAKINEIIFVIESRR